MIFKQFYLGCLAGLALETTPQISVDELHAQLTEDGRNMRIIDVRAPGEYAWDIFPER